MAAIVDRLFRAGEGKILRKLENLAQQVNLIEDGFVSLTDEVDRCWCAGSRSFPRTTILGQTGRVRIAVGHARTGLTQVNKGRINNVQSFVE